MTDQQNTIQHARDVLAKWRQAATVGPWRSGDSGGFADIVSGEWRVALSVDLDDAPLIVGTAGNPDLLDAIDGMLKNAQWHIDNYGSVEHPWANLIATAIIAADERMSA